MSEKWLFFFRKKCLHEWRCNMPIVTIYHYANMWCEKCGKEDKVYIMIDSETAKRNKAWMPVSDKLTPPVKHELKNS